MPCNQEERRHDFQVNRRVEAEIQSLPRRLSLITDKLEDVEDIRRETPAAYV
ncbi:MAG TPA: hypothetical protein VGR96_09570 [Acidobacteriaceae bacterium]|nr:hypothetical protein [Acidobacteriaceae bacterium]